MDEKLKRHYKIRSANLSKKALLTPKGKIVFFGDSITETCKLERYYKGYDCYNAGISGDYTIGLLQRMEENVLLLEPAKVILLCGINDLGNEKREVNDILVTYNEILNKFYEKKIPVLVQSVYPVRKNIDVPQDKIRMLNKGIQELCLKYHYTYINMFDLLLNKDTDELIATYTEDGLHPNKEGFKFISSVMKKYL